MDENPQKRHNGSEKREDGANPALVGRVEGAETYQRREGREAYVRDYE